MSKAAATKLLDDIYSAAKESFLQILENHESGALCGCALYSDSGAMTICMAVDTHENLSSLSEKYPDDAIAFKWSPNEWDCQSNGSESLLNISRKAQKIALNSGNDESFVDVRNSLYEACVCALEKLVVEGFFAKMFPGSITCFSVFGLEGERDMEIDWISRLNDEGAAREFVTWL